MMQIILPRSWREEFALAANLKREEILQRERLAQFAAYQRQITIEKKMEEKRREQEFAMMMDVMVPPVRIAEYHIKLDRYATKTVEATLESAQAGSVELGLKAIEALRTNAENSLSHMEALLGVKSVSELFELQTAFLRKQAEVAVEQAKTLQETSKKVAEKVTAPGKSAAEKAMKSFKTV